MGLGILVRDHLGEDSVAKSCRIRFCGIKDLADAAALGSGAISL